jgi:hypothetical protein
LDLTHLERFVAEIEFFNKLVLAYNKQRCTPPSDPEKVIRDSGANPRDEREIQYDFFDDVDTLVKEKKLTPPQKIPLETPQQVLDRFGRKIDKWNEAEKQKRVREEEIQFPRGYYRDCCSGKWIPYR